MTNPTESATRTVTTEPLTAEAFAPFGDVIEARGAADALINNGKCERFHDRATLSFEGGSPAISLFKAQLRSLPYTLDLIEHHPLGSQCFVPLTNDPFLVIVAQSPSEAPRAFLTNGEQAINFHQGTWHGVLTPLSGSGLFVVMDRIGAGNNLVEHHFEEKWTIINPSKA